MKLTIDQALQQGVAAHKEGKLQDAERFYRAILQSQPQHADANHNLGVLAVAVNKAEAALPLFKTALEANPKIEQFWLSYIDALMKENQFDNAKKVIQQAEKQGLDQEKLKPLKAQLAPKPQTGNANSEKSKKQTKNKKKQKAKKQSLKIRSPSSEELKALLEHFQTGRYGDAEKLAMSLTQEFPKHQFGWKVLGAVLIQTGRDSEAVNANQTAVTLSPRDPAAHFNLGNALKALGRSDEAEVSYRQAIALKPDLVDAHYNLGNLLNDIGRLEEAEASYRQTIILKPDYANAHSNLGNALNELGRLDKAEESYKRAIALKPDYAEAHYNFGDIIIGLGRHQEALNELMIGGGFISFDLKNGMTIL